MARKRLTQVFPFLLPLRKWQRKKFFYYKMRKDGCRYAKRIADRSLPYMVFETSIPMLNENSGFDMQYQKNKVHNLQLAARTLHRVVIGPDETFSFWQLVRWADREEKYKDGLNLVDGKIVTSYGGGLCMLSDTLFWMFLHTPLTIIERHGHAVKSFPGTSEDIPCGTDATVGEGWLDLKVRNETANSFQIEVSFDDKYMHGRILADNVVGFEYSVFNPSVIYRKQGQTIYQIAPVWRRETDRSTGKQTETELYVNQCEIAYKLPDGIKIQGGHKLGKNEGL